MPLKLSEYLNVSPEALGHLGVFDALIGVDSHVFVDPCLLRTTRVAEFSKSYARVREHFTKVMTLLLASAHPGDRAWRAAIQLLKFPELHGIAIGYGVHGANGNAIGPKLAARLVDSASEIIRLGVRDPAIFELLGLFEEDFGPDRLSDMTLHIIRDDVSRFTSRVTEKLKLGNVIEVTSSAGRLLLPVGPDGESLKLVPEALLRDLPVACSWSEISQLVHFNQRLRAEINKLVASFWKPGQKPPKREVRRIVLGNRASIETLLRAYEAVDAKPYNFDADDKGLVRWYTLGAQFARRNPLRLALAKRPSIDEVDSVVDKIVSQFKKHIEDNGLHAHLYGSAGRRRHERFSQLLFFSVADTYCNANNLDLSREPNAGNGPVDFKVSGGYRQRVLVEIKLERVS